MKLIVTIAFFLFFAANSVSQEVVTIPTTFSKNKKKLAKKSKEQIELPFFDEFSRQEDLPDEQLWEKGNVTVSRNLPYMPLSVGCAVLDAAKADGTFYESAGYGLEFYADTLMSLPINLDYQPSENIYLSFAYQAQGLANAPETGDSLFIEFFKPNQNKWQRIKAFAGTHAEPFRQVIIAINDTAFLKQGFKFRFINKASLGSSQNPSLVSNCDFWFIDYVKLDKNRTSDDTVFHDLAFCYPTEFRINNYTSIPAKHYKYAVEQGVKNSYKIIYRNNDNKIRLIDSLNITFEKNNTQTDKISLGSYNVLYYQTVKNSNDNLTYTFDINSDNEQIFNIKTYLVTDDYDPEYNNSVNTKYVFSDYYSYDDGTPEAGYGLTGEGTQNAYVAVKFYAYKEATLTAVDFYFQQTFNNAQANYFRIVIWKQDPETGLPGEIIYNRKSFQVDKDNLNKFVRYNLDSVVTVKDTFFVGWQKVSSDILNIGLDKTNNELNFKYYNILGDWYKSNIEGTIMLRPVFGQNTTSSYTNLDPKDIQIYPNPAINYIKINIKENFRYDIFDINGKKLQTGYNFSDNPIDISLLERGIYIITIYTDKTVLRGRFVVNK